MTCSLCPSEHDLREVEAPAIRLCAECRKKLETHIAIVCSGCSLLYWLPKSAENIAAAAAMSDLPPAHIKENLCLHEIKSCQNCYRPVKDFTIKSEWVQ